MRRTYLIGLLILLLAACGGGDQEEAEPTAPPSTPTEVTINFSGPVLSDPNAEDHSEHGGECSEESGCVSISTPVITEPAEALPLEIQDINGVTVGVPQGYSAQTMGSQIFISAVSPDEAGGFSVVIRPVEQAEVTDLAERYDFEAGTAVETAGLQGNFVMQDDSRVIALLTAQDGRQFLVDARSNPGYWLAYEATFFQMLLTVNV